MRPFRAGSRRGFCRAWRERAPENWPHGVGAVAQAEHGRGVGGEQAFGFLPGGTAGRQVTGQPRQFERVPETAEQVACPDQVGKKRAHGGDEGGLEARGRNRWGRLDPAPISSSTQRAGHRSNDSPQPNALFAPLPSAPHSTVTYPARGPSAPAAGTIPRTLSRPAFPVRPQGGLPEVEARLGYPTRRKSTL